MSRIILHIDMNAFFARCEEIKNPSLIGKPLIVGKDGRRGIVSTASYTARKYGIHSGMPTFQAKMLCKNLIICPDDFEFYELMSREFITYIKKISLLVEQVSVDECFVDITDSYNKYGKNDIMSFLQSIQNGLYNKTKLMCSIGVAPTKFLAKMASDIKKPMGITIIRKKDIAKILFPLPIKDYFGIGKKTYPKLIDLGINTIGDLYFALINNNVDILHLLGNFKNELLNQINGNSSDKINIEHSDPKSIGVTRTLNFDTDSARDLKDFLLNLIDGVIKNMQSQQLLTKTITLVYKNADFETSFETKSFSKTFSQFTDDLEMIKVETSNLFDKTYDGTVLRMVGFSVKNLKNKHEISNQMSFDDCFRSEKEDEIKMIISRLNRKLNSNAFMRLSDLERKK